MRDRYAHRYALVRETTQAPHSVADGHFGHDLEPIHWRDVDDLGRVAMAPDDLLTPYPLLSKAAG